jgi:hypothetical protein
MSQKAFLPMPLSLHAAGNAYDKTHKSTFHFRWKETVKHETHATAMHVVSLHASSMLLNIKRTQAICFMRKYYIITIITKLCQTTAVLPTVLNLTFLLQSTVTYRSSLAYLKVIKYGMKKFIAVLHKTCIRIP